MQVHHHQTQGATIFILNGASSAGKTRIATALQSILPTPYLHVQLDAFESMLPERHGEGMLFSWRTLYPRMLSGFHSSIASLASAGNDLIVDHVMITRDGEDDVLRHRSLDECADLLVQFRCYLIGVHCALGELLRRECQRGEAYKGISSWQYPLVHRGVPYDLEVDTTSLSSVECAKLIASHLATTEPHALRLAAGRTAASP